MSSVSSTSSSTSSASVNTSQTSSSVDRSGLSYAEAVTVKVQPYLDRIDSINSKITANKTKITAYQSMQTLLQNLQTATDTLRNPTYSTTNAFNLRSASLTASDSTTASNVMSTTIAQGTATGTHQIVVKQLAMAERAASSTQTSKSTALGLSGTFTIGEANKTSASISITSGMSLSDIASTINGQSSTTGVTASIITVSSSSSDPQYKLLLTGADTGQAITMSTTSGTALSDLGITGSDGSTAANVLQAAQNAILDVDGVTGIQRDTNDISDILDGVTMHLTQAAPSSTITMKIGNDTSTVESAIESFVTAYNNWRSFVNTNQAVDSSTGAASSSATLFGDSTLRSTSLQIDSAINSLIGGMSLSSIGLTLNASNELEVDSTKLENALANNYSSVQSLFEYQATTSSGDLALSSHGSSTYSGSFTMNVATDSDGNITGVTGTDAAGKAINFTYSGKTISGAKGSAYEGLTFYYSGSTSQSISVTATQGLADQLYQVSQQVGDGTSGTVQTQITNLQTQDSDWTDQASRIQDQANSYATFLLDQYGTLEAKISAANQTQTLLQELMNSDNSSS